MPSVVTRTGVSESYESCRGGNRTKAAKWPQSTSISSRVVPTTITKATVMAVTFVLTMLIPLQYAVLVGVGISMILYIINQSNQVVIKRWVIVDGQMKETDTPADVAPNEVLVLQPYGSLFFASAPVFEEKLPSVTEQTHNSVVILRLRGRSDLGSTFMDVLFKYATALRDQESDLMVVSEDENMHEQLVLGGGAGVAGNENIYTSDEWLGKTVKRAYHDAVARVEANAAQQADTSATDPNAEPPAPEAQDGDPVT